jgi:hypothetical protein
MERKGSAKWSAKGVQKECKMDELPAAKAGRKDCFVEGNVRK